MAVQSSTRAWKAARNAITGAAILGLSAFGAAHAQTVGVNSDYSPTEPSSFSKKECVYIFTFSAEVFGQLQTNPKTGAIDPNKFDARFPTSFAGYLSPSNTDRVSNILIGKTNLTDVLKSPEQTKALAASLTCDGNKLILTAGTEEVAAYNTLKSNLYASPKHLSLDKAGLVSIDPREVAAMRPPKGVATPSAVVIPAQIVIPPAPRG